nr:hypothetical protein [Tanacetum cinerariifolium]
MTKKDEEKKTFHTKEGVFCYTKIPFGLKKARATYQRPVDSAFKEQIKTFSTLRKINMKLNPKKCWFKMEEGKFLRWIEAFEAEFLEMKKLVSELLTLTTPKKGKTLMMYLAAADEAVSAVLLTERDIHHVSRSLQGEETNYALMEKLTLGLVHAAILSSRYFNEGHGDYIPNEASNSRGSRAGLILIAPKNVEYSYTLSLNFSNSNNDAKYKALLAGLQIAMEMQVKDIHAFVDSKLVASQVEGSYEAKENRKADALSKLATVMAKAMNLGYYCPSMRIDAKELIRACDDCQAHASVPKLSKAYMISMEAKPVATITEVDLEDQDQANLDFSLSSLWEWSSRKSK